MQNMIFTWIPYHDITPSKERPTCYAAFFSFITPYFSIYDQECETKMYVVAGLLKFYVILAEEPGIARGKKIEKNVFLS